MSRPTLYLTNLSSKKHHGPGRVVCAMANPAKHHRSDGRCLACAPFADDLTAVRGALAGPDDKGQHRAALAAYRGAFEAGCDDRAVVGRFAPGALSFVTWGNSGNRASSQHVTDGDTLFCACARPGSPKRRTPCHIELLVPYLVRAGWDVRLDGDRVTMDAEGPVWAERHSWIATDGEGRPCSRFLCPGELYRAEDFGWPEAT